jgi:hypothetical protein
MKTLIMLFATIAMAATASAQRVGYSESPFTSDEARAMSTVWPKIRTADSYEDIDWRSVGLARAPGDRNARELMSEHWGRLREAASFQDIDWSSIEGGRAYYRDERSDSDRGRDRDRYGYRDADRYDTGPFTAEEARAMRQVWPRIREAADYDDIDWRAVGLRRSPGDAQARSIMTRYWSQLRNAASFDDIDWRGSTGFRG